MQRKTKLIAIFVLLFITALAMNFVSAYGYYTSPESYDTSYSYTMSKSYGPYLESYSSVDYHKSTDTIYLGNGAYQTRTNYQKTTTQSPDYWGYWDVPVYSYQNYYPRKSYVSYTTNTYERPYYTYPGYYPDISSYRQQY